MLTEKSSKFVCEKCNYNTNNKFDFNKHLTTLKHLNIDKCLQKNLNKSQPVFCNCGKKFSCRQSLHVHKKKCIDLQSNTIIQTNINDINKDDLIITLLQQNKDLLEVLKIGTHNTTNSHNNNKSFNLQFFLNETCKNAMNIGDFVDSIKLKLTDLEKVGELGYVNGISDIIINSLKQLDVTERPLHCTDPKRETIYIKDEDKWQKENDDKKKLCKFIRKIANKNIHMIQEYKAKHPDCLQSDSRFSDKYNKICLESFKLYDNEKEEKIIANIAKHVIIDKTN
jgi:hypothetical protein